MKETERDDVLTDIQVDSAVTREKVEEIESTLNDVQETQSDHDDRITANKTKANYNRMAIGAASATLLTIISGVSGELTKWVL